MNFQSVGLVNEGAKRCTGGLGRSLLVCWLILTLSAFGQEPRKVFSLQGIVRDPAGVAVANATVQARSEQRGDNVTGQSLSDGRYAFSDLPAGAYDLSAAKDGFEASPVTVVSLPAEKERTIELTLGSAKGAGKGSTASDKLQFFDQPQFTVSGVTDTSNLGGHGSNVVVKTREGLAKEAASLGKVPEARSSSDTAAEKSLREDADRDPTNFDTNQRLGQLLVETGRASEAIPYLERASRSKPGNFNVNYQLMLANAKAGNFERARSGAESLLASRDTAELHHLLGDVQERTGHPLEAVRQYQKAAEMDPNEAYLFDWGSELLLHHAPEPAIDVFTRAHRAHPDSVRVLLGLGAAWFARGSYDEAVRTVCQASDMNPQDSSPYVFLGKMQRSEAAPSKDVVQKLRRFVSLRPESSQANYFYAVALSKARKRGVEDVPITQIESLLRKAIQVDLKFAPAHFELGVLHSEDGNDVEAIADYRRAIENDPRMEEAHYRLAQLYKKAGDVARSKEELRLYDQCVKESEQRAERERHEIPQFVYTLRDSPAR